MLPVVTPDEMRAVDAAATEPVGVLVERAGAAVAGAAVRLLQDRTGGVYGRRVVVVAGPGSNGADGRSAARRLARRGANVRLQEPGEADDGADLVIDAAYGTGLSRRYDAPPTRAVAVLAVDVPSGISGLTGHPVDGSHAVQADATVTMVAWKPGLLLGEGPAHAGAVTLAGIGLGRAAAGRAGAWLVTDDDVADLVPRRPREAHKWQSAVQVVAGSPGMTGAPWMVSRAAMRAGAGYVRLGIPGTDPQAAGLPPGELVGRALPDDWPDAVLDGIERIGALVIGPGLGAAGGHGRIARALTGAADTPAVVDADGLNALGRVDAVADVTRQRRAPTVLTPHAGEYARLFGGPPGDDRITAVREAARRSGAVVLLKGPTTVVAEPGGRVLLAAAGTAQLATAGTGDVLSGVIGAFVARGVPAFEAAALGAHVHGRAAAQGLTEGLTATDLPDLVAGWLSAALA